MDQPDQATKTPLIGKIASFFKPKPVFNRPVCTERRYRIARVLYSIFLILFTLQSTVVIGLKAMTIIFIEDNHDTGFEFQTDNGVQGQNTIMAALPRKLYTAPAKLSLIAAAISIFVGIGHVGLVFMDWKYGKRTQAYAFRRNAMFLHFTNSIVILFALISIYVTHKSSSHFSEGYINRKVERPSSNDGMRYNIGTFDLETWSCELRSVDGAKMVWEDYGKQCDIEMAGRVVMIPFVIFGFSLAGLSIWQMVGCNRDANGERIKTDEMGVEMGKFNAT